MMGGGVERSMNAETSPLDASVPRHGAAVGGAADWIPVMADRIVREFRPLKIVLFGSRARGEAHAQSDVDLLVVMPDAWAGARKREAAVGILGALKDLPVYKDVVVTTPEEIARRGDLPGTTLRLALREGRVLYERR
jgi:predicted nucleotidyltransferase